MPNHRTNAPVKVGQRKETSVPMNKDLTGQSIEIGIPGTQSTDEAGAPILGEHVLGHGDVGNTTVTHLAADR